VPKFLFVGRYTAQGLAALRREGAASHGAAIAQVVTGAGGAVEALYWAFGEEDLFCLADLPGTVAAGAVTLAVGMGGDVSLRTVLLETAEEVDAALGGAARLSEPPSGG
jgi:uncharacterized protein with GYD domain